MTESLLYFTTGTGCLALAAGIARTQRRAGRCPRHSRVAGALAWLLAGVSLCAGAGLLGLAWSLA